MSASNSRPKKSAQVGPQLDEFSGRKLRALLPLLASDKDGEVVATAHAIRRTLAAAGMDLHDLARLLTTPVPERPPEPPPKPPERSWHRTVLELLTTHRDCRMCLTPWEVEFLAALAGYHNRAPSAKQLDLVDSILAKVEALHAA